MDRSRFAVLSLVLFVSLLGSVFNAASATVFGPQELSISRWHSHLSRHLFELDQEVDGIIEISKNTPQADIKGGFIIFNYRLISLRRFLTGEDQTFEKDVRLKAKNHLFIFTRGTPGASISLIVRHRDGVTPEITTFSAAPPLIRIGETSTLTWQIKNAETCEISHGIGSVEPQGSINVEPYEPTTYTLTAESYGQIVTATVTVEIENSAPEAIAQELTTAEETAVPIVLAGADADNDPLSFIIHSQPLYGVLAGEAPNLTYTPAENFDRTDSFEFVVNDGELDSEPALVAITVTPINDPPGALDQSINLNEDEPVSVVLGAVDADGDSLTYSIISPPAHGTLSGSPPDLSYRPAANYSGTDSLIFQVNDGEVDSQAATITFDIAPVNDAPVATDDVALTGEDNPVEIDVLGNDNDADGDMLSISIASQPSMGMVDVNPDGSVAFIPSPNYFGTDGFSYTVSDPDGATDTATVSITIWSINDIPVATDDAVAVDEDDAVVVDLIANDRDADGDVLTIIAITEPSYGSLQDHSNGSVTYVPNADYDGSDSFTYTVSDATGASDEGNVSISITPINDPPVADAGPDRTVSRLEQVVLNGSGSGDAENDPLTYQWTLKSIPSGSTAGLANASSASPSFAPDLNGDYKVELVVNDGYVDSLADVITITAVPRQVSVPAVINTDRTAAEAAIAAADLVVGTIADEYNQEVPAGHIVAQHPAGGNIVAEGTAVDLVLSLGPEIQPPVITISAAPAEIQPGSFCRLTWSATNAQKVYIDNNVGQVNTSGTLEVFPDHTVTYTVAAIGPHGNASAQVTVKVIGLAPVSQPEGSYGERYEDQIPADSTVEEYDPRRFALITGKVQDAAGTALSGVSIIILNHAEYGTAETDGAGTFTIAVEGGESLNVVYQKKGFIPAQRKVHVPWNDSAVADAVVMLTEDPLATTLTFDENPETVVTHKSTDIVDESGTRALTMVLTGDNKAWLLDEKGRDVAALETITVRATEYTTPESMPAKLPPTSAFTYCAELTVDGARRVRFDKPVITWIDNFLEVPVGEIVPVGYFDADKGVWVPDENGLVVKLLDMDGDGIVDALDSDGDSQPDDLNGNQSFGDEVRGLEDNRRYVPGSTFWRSETTHFSSRDWNYPLRTGPDAIEPNPSGLQQADQKNINNQDSPMCLGSFVEQKSRIFHEDILIPGTSLTLHYDSSRTAGYTPGVVTVPASGDTVPDSLLRIIVKASVAGRTYEVELPGEPNQSAEIVWDGLDHLGRAVFGSVNVHVQIGFVYNGVYWVPDGRVRAFGQTGTRSLYIPSRIPVTLWKNADIKLTRVNGTIAEGWTISEHHSMSPSDPSMLFKGDGSINKNNAMIIDTYAGNGSSSKSYGGMGGLATKAQIPLPSSIAMDSGGNLYLLSSHLAGYQNWQSHILKVDNQGIVTELFYAPMRFYHGYVAVDPQGNLYWSRYAVWGGSAGGEGGCVIKRSPDGVNTTVFGSCESGDTSFRGITFAGIHADNQGNLYTASPELNQVLKKDPSGLVTAVAGNGSRGFGGDGGNAQQAKLNAPEDLYVDDEGNMFIAEYGRVRKVDPGGVITTVAGGGSFDTIGNGGPATEAYFRDIEALAKDSEGNLYLADSYHHLIRRIDTSGTIITVAGINYQAYPDQGHYSGDGGAATNARFDVPTDILIDPAGNLFITDMFNGRVRKVSPPAPGMKQVMESNEMAFTESSGVGYIMSAAGNHQRTVDLDTGVSLYEFDYDENNNLIGIIDQHNNRITVEWANGVATAIVSPDGLRTELTVDTATGHLTRITHPDNSVTDFEYAADGLLELKIEPERNQFGHDYDDHGRVAEFYDDEGGLWSFTRTVTEGGGILNEVVSGEENRTAFLDYTDSTGAYQATVTAPTGDESFYSQSADGLTATRELPCGMAHEYIYDVDREYKYRYLKEQRAKSPQGLQKIRRRTRGYQDTNADGLKDRFTDQITVNGKTTTIENDTLQSKQTVTSPEARLSTIHYDAANLQIDRISVPGLFDTTYGYDPRGRLTSVNTHTRSTTFAYNTDGFIDHITNPETKTTYYTYDPVGRITGISRPDSGTIGFSYDDNGNMTVLTNVDIDHGFGFNNVNKNRSYTTPLSGSYIYEYDRDRRLVQTTFPSGRTIVNDYADPANPDDKSRLWQIRSPEGNIDFTYLCGTKVDSITKDTESITYGYDGKLVTSEALAGTLNQSLVYTYNKDFDVSGFTYAGGAVSYNYDNDGLLTGAGNFAIIRNASNGLPESVADNALELDRTFNGYGEMDSQNLTVSGQSIASWSLIRNNNGRITNKTETVNGTMFGYTYTYDGAGRLLTVTQDGVLVEEYRYDLNGTRTYEMNFRRGIAGRSYSYSDEDQLLSAGPVTYAYDQDGFLTTKTDGSDMTSYTYSSRGELLDVTLSDGRIIEYVHDPLGRRIAKKVNGVITEKYLWQGMTQLLAVYDGADNLLMRFEYADDRVPMAMTREGVTYYLAYDQVGSIRSVADSAGNVVKNIEYDSFGNVIADSNPGFSIPFGFAGGLYDRDTGLVRFGYRDYAPEVGRWTAKDPIGFAGGDTDLYGYVLNDPINLVDPIGLLRLGDVINWASSIMVPIAREGGLITAKIATRLSIVGSVLGELVDPPSLNANESWYLHRQVVDAEIEEYQRMIDEINKQLDPVFDRYHVFDDQIEDDSLCP